MSAPAVLERAQKPPTRKPARPRLRAAIAAGLLALITAASLYWNSQGFHEAVRQKIVAELERGTGGQAEIQSVAWNLFRLRLEINGLTIQGRESASHVPYVHADHIALQAKWTSLLLGKMELRSLDVDRPVIHLTVYPDGTASQPAPPASQQGSASPVALLFDLSVDSLQVTGGELLVNQRRIPFAFAGDHFSAGLVYSQKDRAFDGSLALALLVPRPPRELPASKPPVRAGLSAHFLLRPAETEIKALELRVGNSTLNASGTVASYNDPVIQAQYHAAFNLENLQDLMDLAGLPGYPGPRQLRARSLEVNGSAIYRSSAYSSQGKLAVHGLEWHDTAINVSGIELASPFSLSPQKVDLPEIAARVFGGSAQGALRITNWSTPPQEGKSQQRNLQQRKPSQGTLAPQFGRVDLHLNGLQVGQAAAAFSTARLPFKKADLAGAAFGDIHAHWTGPFTDATTEIKLDIRPPAHPSPQQVPLTAQIQATYNAGGRQLDIAGLSLATRALRLSASGALGSEKAQMNVALDAADFHEFQAVLDARGPGSSLPVSLDGRASFNGVVSGKFSELGARGRMDLGGFNIWMESESSRPPAKARSSVIHWDSLLADLAYTPTGLSVSNGVARRGKTEIAVSGSVGLEKNRFDADKSWIAANLRVQNIPLAEVQPLFGLPLAGVNAVATGILSGNMRIAGPLRAARGSGSLQAADLAIYGEPFRSFRSDMSFAGKEVQFSNIVLAHNGAQLKGSASYNLGDRVFHFDVDGAGIELASLRRFEPQRIAMDGKADFHVSGSGTAEMPAIDGRLNIRNLALNGESAGDIQAAAETRGTELVLRAQSNFQNAALTMEGSLHLRDNFPGRIEIKFQHLDFDSLIRAYLQGRITGHSSMEGSMEIHGPMKTPRGLMMEASISQLSASVENVSMKNDGPVRFSIANEVIKVDQFHLAGDGMDLDLSGTVQLAGERNVDVHSNGHLNLKLLQGYSPGVIATGAASLTVHVRGTTGHPRFSGSMDIADAGISFADFPNGLSQIGGKLAFAEDRIQIEKLTAHTGGGVLDIGGFIAYRNGLYFDVTAAGKEVRLRYPPGISASANAGFRYTGSAQSSELSGDVTIIRFAINPNFDFARYLGRSASSSAVSKNPFLENLRLDVHIVSTPELRVETSLAKVSGDVDLHIRGTVANPSVLGRVNIAEGNVSVNGTKYRLERGDITFGNPQMIQPVINMEMGARIRDYDISIGFHGPVEKLSATYRSDPPLPSADIIALIAFGRTREEDLYNNQAAPGSNTSASDIALDQALNSASGSRVQKLFGASSVKIDPQVGGAENNPNPRVTIEQQIKNNLTVTYISNLSQSSSEQVIQVEYNINKTVSIVGVRDQNGILGFDLRIRSRKK